jgi:hypothetical protein
MIVVLYTHAECKETYMTARGEFAASYVLFFVCDLPSIPRIGDEICAPGWAGGAEVTGVGWEMSESGSGYVCIELEYDVYDTIAKLKESEKELRKYGWSEEQHFEHWMWRVPDPPPADPPRDIKKSSMR